MAINLRFKGFTQITGAGRGLYKLIILVLGVSLAALQGCGSGDAVTAKDGPEAVFKEAKIAFDDENYLEAKRLFNVIRLQYPASPWADDAQFYLAEINYLRQEYILGAYNYSSLYRSFPGSEFLKEAYYREALCYYELSPSHYRDQNYTLDAIRKFSEFQTFFPNDSLASQADIRIAELREKLSLRDFETAELYVNMHSLRSALIYYDSVIDNYPDTRLLEPAFYGKISCLVQLERYDEAREAIRLYRQTFTRGEFLEEISNLESEMD